MLIQENLDPIGIPWPVSRRWEVGLVHAAGTVTQILVKTREAL